MGGGTTLGGIKRQMKKDGTFSDEMCVQLRTTSAARADGGVGGVLTKGGGVPQDAPCLQKRAVRDVSRKMC